MLGSSAEVEMAVDLLFHCEVNDSNILFFFFLSYSKGKD